MTYEKSIHDRQAASEGGLSGDVYDPQRSEPIYIYNDGEIAIVANGEICRMPLKIFLEMASEMPGVAEDIKDLQRMGVLK